jgi:hypothetical protein
MCILKISKESYRHRRHQELPMDNRNNNTYSWIVKTSFCEESYFNEIFKEASHLAAHTNTCNLPLHSHSYAPLPHPRPHQDFLLGIVDTSSSPSHVLQEVYVR